MDKTMNRREALKCMGAAVPGSAVASSGLLSLTACSTESKKRVVLFFDMNEQMKVDKHIPEHLARISKDLSEQRHWHEPVSELEREQHQGFLERSGIDPKKGFIPVPSMWKAIRCIAKCDV